MATSCNRLYWMDNSGHLSALANVLRIEDELMLAIAFPLLPAELEDGSLLIFLQIQL
jgi:hypothetical protein